MKGDYELVMRDLLLNIGVIAPCRVCGCDGVWADDENAAQMAYARAVNLQKDGCFGRMEREDVMHLVKDELDGIPRNCPACARSASP